MTTIDDITRGWPEWKVKVFHLLQKNHAKPCPFCGGEAKPKLRQAFPNGKMQWYGSIACDTVNCRGNIPFEYPPIEEFGQEIIRWNKRSRRQPITDN